MNSTTPTRINFNNEIIVQSSLSTQDQSIAVREVGSDLSPPLNISGFNPALMLSQLNIQNVALGVTQTEIRELCMDQAQFKEKTIQEITSLKKEIGLLKAGRVVPESRLPKIKISIDFLDQRSPPRTTGDAIHSIWMQTLRLVGLSRSLFHGKEWHTMTISRPASITIADPENLDLQEEFHPFVKGQPVQLLNDGSSCFINSGFQLLMNAPPLVNSMLRHCRRSTNFRQINHLCFLEAAARYFKSCKKGLVNTGMKLSTLRQFMPVANRHGQQDSIEWLRNMFNSLRGQHAGDPCTLFTEIRRQYEPYVEQDEAQLARLARYRRENRAVHNLPPLGAAMVESGHAYELIIPIPENQAEEVDGQALITRLFEPQDNPPDEPVILKDSSTNELNLYKVASKSMLIDLTHAQGGFLVTLMRFQQGRKINQKVIMPQYPTFFDTNLWPHTHEVISIIRHRGTFDAGHYWALIKKNTVWWLCDDQKPLRPATRQEIQDGFEYGYGYYVVPQRAQQQRQLSDSMLANIREFDLSIEEA